MRLELQFNEPIYRKQMQLLYEMGYGKKRAFYKNANYFGVGLVFIGVLAVVGKSNMGYVFIILGLGMLISYYRYYFVQKEIARQYEAEQLEIITALKEKPTAVFEFKDEGLDYSDYTGTIQIPWEEFLTFTIKEENMFLITKSFRPFAFGKLEIGEDNYNQVLRFIVVKMGGKGDRS